MFRGFESHRLRQKQRLSLRWPLFLAFGDGGIRSRVKKTSQCSVFSGMGRIPPRLTRKQLGAVLSIPAVGLLETVEIQTGSVVNEAPAEPQNRAHGPPRTAGRIPPQLTRTPLGAASHPPSIFLCWSSIKTLGLENDTFNPSCLTISLPLSTHMI